MHFFKLQLALVFCSLVVYSKAKLNDRVIQVCKGPQPFNENVPHFGTCSGTCQANSNGEKVLLTGNCKVLMRASKCLCFTVTTFLKLLNTFLQHLFVHLKKKDQFSDVVYFNAM